VTRFRGLGSGFRSSGSGFRISGLGLNRVGMKLWLRGKGEGASPVDDVASRFRVSGSGSESVFRVFRDPGSGFRSSVPGFEISGFGANRVGLKLWLRWKGEGGSPVDDVAACRHWVVRVERRAPDLRLTNLVRKGPLSQVSPCTPQKYGISRRNLRFL